jgi:hypothetical protein
LTRPYRARAKISLNNTLKSRFIRRAHGTNIVQIAGIFLTIRSPRRRRFANAIRAAMRRREGADGCLLTERAARAGALC